MLLSWPAWTYKAMFLKLFCLHTPFGFKKVITNPHIIADAKIGCLDNRCPKLKICVSKLIYTRVMFTVSLISDWLQNKWIRDCWYLSTCSVLTSRATSVKIGVVYSSHKVGSDCRHLNSHVGCRHLVCNDVSTTATYLENPALRR